MKNSTDTNFELEILKQKARAKIRINQDLSYGEILPGRPGAWLVKKIFFICMQSKKLKKEIRLKFKMISKTCLNFMIAFMVYE